jgi:glycosyltransferase involved in cell wall biosynthesis
MKAEHGANYDIMRMFNYELQMNKMDMALESRIKVIDTSPPNRLTDKEINQIYHATDIGVNTSDGEGYGLCTLEHLFTGKPQIVTDIGVYRSFLTDDVLEYIPRHERMYYAGTLMLGFFAPTFSVIEVAKAMKRMLDTLKEKTEASKQFRFRTWEEVLQPLMDDIKCEIEV